MAHLARSAITGRFVSLLYALRHPRTTIIERRQASLQPVPDRYPDLSSTFPDEQGNSSD